MLGWYSDAICYIATSTGRKWTIRLSEMPSRSLAAVADLSYADPIRPLARSSRSRFAFIENEDRYPLFQFMLSEISRPFQTAKCCSFHWSSPSSPGCRRAVQEHGQKRPTFPARRHNLTHRTGGSWRPCPPPPASAGSSRSAVEPAPVGRSRFLKRRPLQELKFA